MPLSEFAWQAYLCLLLMLFSLLEFLTWHCTRHEAYTNSDKKSDSCTVHHGFPLYKNGVLAAYVYMFGWMNDKTSMSILNIILIDRCHICSAVGLIKLPILCKIYIPQRSFHIHQKVTCRELRRYKLLVNP